MLSALVNNLVNIHEVDFGEFLINNTSIHILQRIVILLHLEMQQKSLQKVYIYIYHKKEDK